MFDLTRCMHKSRNQRQCEFVMASMKSFELVSVWPNNVYALYNGHITVNR